MREEDIRTASDFLTTIWREGRHVEKMPDALRPATRTEAYAVQACVEKLSKQPLAGWKIAATSLAGQKHINVSGPMGGRLLAERIVPLGQTVRLGSNRMRVAEVEFVFRMGTTLSPRTRSYEQAEVLSAVAALHLGIEVPDSRYLVFERAGEEQIIADNACAHQFVLGPEVNADWRQADLGAHVVRGLSSRGFVHEGRGANVLGGPTIALTWLANELSRLGVALGRGQIITTGTCCVPVPIMPGDLVTGDYGTFGSLEVAFG
ncbi:2-keto-4-pentenoate hydratase [Mesorhizobium yinganensis]|uniref:2-keto-4-pentenoate hydratase n=1 Tax=Mesorhizobium yinganensis TaxID=3157707 RepID=UPI0032B80FB6